MKRRALSSFARAAVVLLLVTLSSLQPALSSERTPFTTVAHEAVSVWSKITIGMADAYSTVAERPIEDCLRPKRVDCFSIQQNFWITDSLGNFVLWAQNTVELAKLASPIYYGTYTFQVWNSSTVPQPVLCEPESSRTTSCRAPFYTDPVPFPQSFIFYSHISSEGAKYVLQMSNNLGAITWAIPSSVKCPCYIGTVLDKSPPWGQTPFELVAVGLDSSAMAFFRNDTIGTFGPILVESADGSWHKASVEAIHCLNSGGCPGMLATAETSMNLVWNSTSGEFYWSAVGSDQGAYVSTVSAATVDPPPKPTPSTETFLYAEFRSTFAYLTIYDAQERALGVDPQSGKRVEEIPNASITHNSSEDLLIVNPTGEYVLVLTAGGNTAFQLFVSKATNTGSVSVGRRYNGTLNVGYSTSLHINVNDMILIPQVTNLSTELAPVAGIILMLLGFVGVIAAVLILRRKRSDA
ncbi:MAG: hypothetical protein ABSC50_10155 [Candidatus Bathyarchaeia archaeon]